MRDNRPLVLPVMAAIVCGTLIICVYFLASSLIRVKRGGELIHVTGSNHKTIRSDYIIWQCTLSEEKPNVADAYSRVKADSVSVVAYLAEHGVPSQEIYTLPIVTTALHPPLDQNANHDDPTVSRPVLAYRLTQGIQVRSNDVARVDSVARSATELISRGISLTSEAPQYLYTKMDSLKVTMLNEAAKDARNRADAIAASCGSKAGDLRYARAGVMQIEAATATEGITDIGANNTTSLDKKVTAIVKADFSIR